MIDYETCQIINVSISLVHMEAVGESLPFSVSFQIVQKGVGRGGEWVAETSRGKVTRKPNICFGAEIKTLTRESMCLL